uniref:Uncharacterized protein n=1 Tax=Glossina brevipalpis TaxID=37001 RepID=A0A1A9W2C7_9MUSC
MLLLLIALLIEENYSPMKQAVLVVIGRLRALCMQIDFRTSSKYYRISTIIQFTVKGTINFIHLRERLISKQCNGIQQLVELVTK